MQTAYDLVWMAAERSLDQLAMVDDVTGRALTYRQLMEEIDCVAAGLAARNVGQGTRVASALPTQWEHGILLLALTRLGAVPMLLNFRLKPEDFVEYNRRTSQDAIVVNISPGAGPRGSITSPDQLDAIEDPDPAAYREKIKHALDVVSGTNQGVLLHACAPFFKSYCAMGPVSIQSFLLNLCDDLPFCVKLMDLHHRWQMSILEEIIDLPIDIIDIADDIAGTHATLASPAMMDELWVPYLDDMVKVIRKNTCPIMFHCCGKLDYILPHLVRNKVEAIHPVQPAANDIRSVKKEWGEYITLIGNINIEGTMAFGTPDQVRSEARDLIDDLAGNSGYVCASSHSIVDAIPHENWRALIEETIEHGAY